ncbi:MAG: hypothetical protein IPK99_11355 [Flavobacteriales bacterium]|nr:hypothetical protein [Flavobacteriales bacterium]
MRSLLLLLASVLFISTQAQEAMNDRELIQFSGVVVSGDSLVPVPSPTSSSSTATAVPSAMSTATTASWHRRATPSSSPP